MYVSIGSFTMFPVISNVFCFFLSFRIFWLTHLGSTLPLRVAPGNPARGVKPIEVSQLFPFLMAHALAPLPRCSAMILRSLRSFPRNCATALVMNS